MTREEIIAKARLVIADKLSVKEKEVTETANFQKDLGADSLSLVELTMEIEDQFNIKDIPDDVAAKLLTLDDVANFILTSQTP